MPPLRQNQFGVNVGGPLKRDQTFFFFSYEGQRIRKAQTQTFSVPTAALRGGDFSGLAPLCDPLTRTAAGTCTPFAGNQIPANRISPVAAALLAKVPLPTSGGLVQNLLGVEDQVNPMNQFSLKLDHRLGPNDTLFGRFTTFRVDDTQPFGTSVAERGAGSRLRPNGDHQQRERRPRSHPRVRLELAERSPLRLSQRPGRAGESRIRASTSRRCPACRA